MIRDVLTDIRYGVRAAFSRPTFAAIVVLTLALGIGATTAIFSVVNAVLLRPLPYVHPDRVVQLFETVPAGELPGFDFPVRSGMNVAELDEWRKAKTLLQVAVLGIPEARILTTDDRTVRLNGTPVSAALFALRGVKPLLGRGLLPEEERADADVVVLGEAAWREHFGADPGIVGRRISLDGHPLTVAGVMPAEFGSDAFWTPYLAPPGFQRTKLRTFARLRDGVSLETAAAEINALGTALRGITPQPAAAPRFELVRELDEITARVVPALRVLVVAVAAVLLIVCSNVANLLLVRGTQRQREIAIRRSLGATRGRIVRLVLVESLTLAVVAGVLGVAIAFGAVQLLKAVAIVDLPQRFQAIGAVILPRAEDIAIDPIVLLFVAGLAVVTGTMFGVLPALRLSRFGERGHNAAAELSAVASNTRIGHVLATVQLAFAMALLIGAGLLLNSFLKLSAVDAGFDPRGVLTFELVVPRNTKAERKLEVAQTLAARLHEDTRVTAVGFADIPPLAGGTWIMANFVPEGMTAARVQETERALPFAQKSGTRTVSAGYLRALGARLVDGAWLASQPSPADFDVLVTRAYAQRYFAGRRAVGATLTAGGRTATIVGVVDDIHLGSLDGTPESVVFMEPAQSLPVQRAGAAGMAAVPGYFDQLFLSIGFINSIAFAARVDGDPLAIAADLRGIARDIDPAFAVEDAMPMEAVLSGVTTRPRFYASLLSAFGAIAAFVALIGIYGVLAYLVSQRTREIGVRMALGAQRANVLRLVLKRGVTMIAIGVTAGVLGALGLARYLAGMLYGITAFNATTYVAVAAAFGAVALLASYLPARRATRVNPITVLRYE